MIAEDLASSAQNYAPSTLVGGTVSSARVLDSEVWMFHTFMASKCESYDCKSITGPLAEQCRNLKEPAATPWPLTSRESRFPGGRGDVRSHMCA